MLDLSAPYNDHDISINCLIDRDKCSMAYIKIDDAIKIITQYGISTLLCKYDISDAFKIIPVKSDQWSLCGADKSKISILFECFPSATPIGLTL